MASIHVCPLCFELADYSDDYGWSVYCEHPPYESIEPVEVEGVVEEGRWVFLLPDAEEWKRTIGAEIVAAQDKRKRARAEWLALSCDERVAINQKKREESAFLMTDVIRDTFASLIMRDSKQITVPCPRCHDVGCENATVKDNPSYVSPDFWRGGYTVRVEGG